MAIAVGACAAGVFSVVPGAPGVRTSDGRGDERPPRFAGRRIGAVLGVSILLTLVGTVGPLRAVAMGGVSGAALWLAGRLVARDRGRRASRAQRECVAAFVVGVAAELRAGADAREAVRRAASPAAPLPDPPHGWLSEVTAEATSGGNVAAVLRRAARLPGAQDLGEVAACWEVAHRSGGGLAAGLETVAASMAQRENFRDRLDADLAGVRAGGWLLGALPLVGLVLGAVLGARPWAVLFGTRIGGVFCLTGVLLDALGVLWLRRMIKSVRAIS